MLTKKDKKKRYNRPYKQGRGHQFGWGAATKVAMRENPGGAVGGLVGAASVGINAGMQNAELVGVEEAQADVDARRNFQSTASTNDDLLAEMMGATNMKSDFDFKDFMQDGKTLAMNTINATMQGAASGASAGPWGAVAGAAAGLLGGVGGIIGGRVKAGVEAAQKKEAARRANAAQAQVLTSKAGALDQAADARSLAAYYAEGGRLGKTPQFPEFPSSLVKFNTGGTHEENPHDGIPQGIAPDGLPNLVEEGEVKYDDYIFSDRLMLNKQDKKKYKFLSGNTYADAADRIAKESTERPNDLISKNTRDANLKVLEFLQERERTKRGLRGENRMMYAFGGHTFDGTLPHIYTDSQGNIFTNFTPNSNIDLNAFNTSNNYTNVADQYEVSSAGTEGAIRLPQYRVWVPTAGAPVQYHTSNGNNVDYTGITGKYAKHAQPEIWVKKKPSPEPQVSIVEENPIQEKSVEVQTPPPTVSANPVTPVVSSTSSTPRDLGKQWYYTDVDNKIIIDNDISRRRDVVRHSKKYPNLPLHYGKLLEIDNTISAAEDPILSFQKNAKAKDIRNAYDKQFGTGLDINNLLQAAPAVGNAIGMMTQAFNTPDYKHAKELQQGEQNTFTPISYTPLTQRMTYKPMDVNYYGSKLGAQASAARQAIRQQTATNPYAAIAALLAADANAQSQLGDLYKKAEEYNLAQREKVDTFNRSIDSANAEMAMKAQQLNASLRDSADKRQLERDTMAAKLKLAEDQAFSESMSANMTGLFDNLGAIGKEKISNMNAFAKLLGDDITYTDALYPWLVNTFGQQNADVLKEQAVKRQAAKGKEGKKAYGGKLKRKKGYTI